MISIKPDNGGTYGVIIQNQWGAAPMLSDALTNCGLVEQRRIDHFECIESALDLEQRFESWKEWGREEYEMASPEEPERVIIYWLSWSDWESFDIDDIDGHLKAIPQDKDQAIEKTQANFRKARIDATWYDGVLTPL